MLATRMTGIRAAVVLGCVLLAPCGAVLADMVATLGNGNAVGIEMQFYGQVGKTAMYMGRLNVADLGPDPLGTIYGVRVIDSGEAVGGSGGVFSGFDADCVFFDFDGNPNTLGDQIAPLTDRDRTYVIPGTADYPSKHRYTVVSSLTPPLLFGLNGSNQIRHYIATLGVRDASYVANENFGIRTSNGWVTLGDGGVLFAGFPFFSLEADNDVWLFVGDAGMNDENMDADVEVVFFPPQGSGDVIVPLGWENGNGPARIAPGDRVYFDGPYDFGDYRWDFDCDGKFDDGVGQMVALTFDLLTNELHLPMGEHTVRLLADGMYGEPIQFEATIMLVPEPATVFLLAAGAVVLTRRRNARS